MSTKVKNVILLIVCIAGPLLVGFLSSMLSGDIRGIYDSMNKPPLAPPGELFGIVWPILYLLMGIALYLIILRTEGKQRTTGLVLFFIQLILNFFWCIAFFGADSLWIAFGIILFLDAAIIAITVFFFRDSKPISMLFVPYLIWIVFATYLNVGFALLN